MCELICGACDVEMQEFISASTFEENGIEYIVQHKVYECPVCLCWVIDVDDLRKNKQSILSNIQKE